MLGCARHPNQSGGRRSHWTCRSSSQAGARCLPAHSQAGVWQQGTGAMMAMVQGLLWRHRGRVEIGIQQGAVPDSTCHLGGVGGLSTAPQSRGSFWADPGR